MKAGSMNVLFRAALAAVAAFALGGASPPQTHWVASWASSQQVPEERNALPAEALEDATLRQFVTLSISGQRLRVLLSNAFGTEPLRIDAAHVALANGSATSRVIAATGKALTFDGAPGVIIPPGASYWSDDLTFDSPARATLAVTIYLPHAPKVQTSHPGSRTTSYYVHGNRVADEELADSTRVDHWYLLAGVAVEAPPESRAVAIVGDSITDGFGTTTNGNDRWTDHLVARFQASPETRAIAVLNHGLGGNRVLNNGLGPNALARFDRDVIAQPGVRYAIILEGVNDLGTLTRDAPVSAEEHQRLVRRLIGAYRQMVARGRSAGIKVYGGTIPPFGTSGYYHPDDLNEADRQAVNEWVRTPGNFDGVIDFDAALRDPADPRRLKAEFDSGDGLHPSLAGYRAMAEAVPLELFR